MKSKIALFCLLVLCFSFVFTSCSKKDDPTSEGRFSQTQLRAGTWTISHVDANTFDGAGNLIGTERFPFGEGTEGGICTFTYDTNDNWTLNDNGEIFTARYTLDDRIVYTEGGGTWGIRTMTDDKMEIVLRSDETLNPCAYTVSGAVYTLTRNRQ